MGAHEAASCSEGLPPLVRSAEEGLVSQERVSGFPEKGADLQGSPGNFRGSVGNFRGSLGNFRGTSSGLP